MRWLGGRLQDGASRVNLHFRVHVGRAWAARVYVSEAAVNGRYRVIVGQGTMGNGEL